MFFAILLLLGSLVPLVQVLPAYASGPVVPSGILNYVPVTLTNSQNVATTSPFDQMVTVDSSSAMAYEAPNLQNVEFFDALGSVIPSWLESGNSNSAANTTYWLKIAGGIPALASLTVYMGFASKPTNLLNSAATGEAPQLSPSYGQYDDGANVFTFYDDFATGTPSSAWLSNIAGSATRNNGLNVAFGESNAYYVTKSTFGPGTTFDAFVLSFGDTENAGYINVTQHADPRNYGPGVGWAATGIQSACINVYPTQLNITGEANSCGGTDGSFYSGVTTVKGVYTVDPLSPVSSLQYINYSKGSTVQPIKGHAPTYPANVGFMLNWIGCPTCTSNTLSVQWVRVRSAPPGGVLPTASVGSVGSPTPTQVSSGVSGATYLASDSQGNLYFVANSNNFTTNLYMLRRETSTPTMIAAVTAPNSSLFESLGELHIDGAGNVYGIASYSDQAGAYDASQLVRFDRSSSFSKTVLVSELGFNSNGSQPVAPGSELVGLTVDSAGDVYYSQYTYNSTSARDDSQFFKIPSGNITPGLLATYPNSSPSNSLDVYNGFVLTSVGVPSGVVIEITPSSRLVTLFIQPTPPGTSRNYGAGTALDGAGNLYFFWRTAFCTLPGVDCPRTASSTLFTVSELEASNYMVGSGAYENVSQVSYPGFRFVYVGDSSYYRADFEGDVFFQLVAYPIPTSMPVLYSAHTGSTTHTHTVANRSQDQIATVPPGSPQIYSLATSADILYALSPTGSILAFDFGSSSSTNDLSGGGVSSNQGATTGVTVAVTGSSSPDGTKVSIGTQNNNGTQPPATFPPALISPLYYDVRIQGIADGSTQVCITNDAVTPSTVMEYWTGNGWVLAGSQTVSGTTICGFIPVSSLGRTPIVIGVSESPGTSSSEPVAFPSVASVSCSSPITVGNPTTCIASLTRAPSTLAQAPEAVSFSSSAPGTFSPDSTCYVNPARATGSCSVQFLPSSAGSSPISITASYAGDDVNKPSSGTFLLTVNQASKNVQVSCAPATIGVGLAASCVATVGGTGIVSWSQTGGTGGVSVSPSSCSLISNQCTVSVVGSSPGTITLKAAYGGDADTLASSATTDLVVTPISATCSAVPTVGKSTTCTVNIFGAKAPTGKVTWSISGPGKLTPPTCKLSSTMSTKSSCSVRYTPASAQGPVSLTVAYRGDKRNPASSATFSLDVEKATPTTTVRCSPTSTKAGSSKLIHCSATVKGFKPTGTIAWSSVGGDGTALASSGTCVLAAGRCSVTLAGRTAGSIALQARYSGDTNNFPSAGTENLTIT